jgi:O-antigen/teichoic acid export membrane protein
LAILSFAFVLTAMVGPAQILITMLNRERVAVGALCVALAGSTLTCALLAGPFGAMARRARTRPGCWWSS